MPEPSGRIELELRLSGREHEPLRVQARARHASFECASASALSLAQGTGLDDELLVEKLGALGGTPFRIARLDRASLPEGLHLPVSELKALRRALVDGLLPSIERGPRRALAETSQLDVLQARARAQRAARSVAASPAQLLALCRSAEQLEAVIAAGLHEVELDWMELVGLARAVERARCAGLRVTVATVRVQKPGEDGYDRRLAALQPDAVLVRHWGGMVHFQDAPRGDRPPLLHGDFSLNVTNSVCAAELFDRGLATLTAAHDLDETQLFELLGASLPERITVVLHQRIATFHTEHCVYAHLLSGGRDFRSCGRPCEEHRIALRDHKGREHPVIVDVGCRNTVFNSEPQSAALLVPRLIEAGVRRFRVEFVRETQAETAELLECYAALLRGELAPELALRRAGARAQFGVSRAPMQVMH